MTSFNRIQIIKMVLTVLGTFSIYPCALASSDIPWCSNVARIETSPFTYPPIARAARVSGTVIGRVTISPDGAVQAFEALSGPRMLISTVDTQVQKWTFKPRQESQGCQALLIASFTIDRDKNPDSTPAPSNGIKVWINTVAVTINTTNYSRSAE